MKPGYKLTEVGVIPKEWEVKEIDSICGTITTGKLDANAMRPDGPYRFYTCAKNYYQIDKYAFDCEALLISGNGAHVGYIHYYQGKFNAYQRTYVLFGFKKDIKFIQHYLSENFKKRIEVEVKAGGTPYITRPTIAETAIPLPPLPEQRAIAAALSDVDGLLGGLDRLIAKKRDLKQAAMQQLLTGQTRLPGFKGEWEVKRLGDAVQIQKGQLITGKTLQPGDIPVIAGGKQPAYYHAAANRTGRTITVSASGASAGYVALYNRPIFASDCSTISESMDYSLDFVFYQLLCKQQAIYKAQTGGAQPHIHAKDLNPIPIPFPLLPEQTAIAAVLSEMDAELVALEQRRDKTRALKQGMMQELLTGRTRLVE